MGLESATFISELVPTNPVGAVDDYATADDHLRLIKSVLQSQFPNFTALAVNPSSVELNLLVGLLASSAEINILDGALLSTAELNTLNGILASTAELNKLNGVTSLTADLNLLSGAAAGGLTAAELLFVNDVTSAIQAQLNGKAPTAHSHTGAEISALDTADVTTGVWANARVSAGNVTQHVGALDHDLLLNFLAAEHIDWAVTGAENLNSDRLPAASETVVGGTELATQAEVDAEADTTRIVTPATLAAKPTPVPADGTFAATKSADTDRNTTVTLTIDPDLQITSVPIGKYVFLARIDWNPGNAVMGFRWKFDGSAGMTFSFSDYPFFILGSTTLETQGFSIINGSNVYASGAASYMLNVQSVVDVTAAGTFAFYWAQNVSDAANLGVDDNSGITLIRIE